jgi:hypothetical protein
LVEKVEMLLLFLLMITYKLYLYYHRTTIKCFINHNSYRICCNGGARDAWRLRTLERKHARLIRNDYDRSKTILESISEVTATLSVKLFESNSAAYAVAVSAIITKEAQEFCQGHPPVRGFDGPGRVIVGGEEGDPRVSEQGIRLRGNEVVNVGMGQEDRIQRVRRNGKGLPVPSGKFSFLHRSDCTSLN